MPSQSGVPFEDFLRYPNEHMSILERGMSKIDAKYRYPLFQ